MKHLIKIANGQPVVSSKVVADEFGREHKNLMQNLRSLIESGHLGELDFKPSSYTDKQNKNQPCFELTERGFLIAMPFIGVAREDGAWVYLAPDDVLKMEYVPEAETEATAKE